MIDELKKRCEEAGLEYASSKSEEPNDFWVFLPRGRETSRLFVLSDEAAKELLELPFEKWRAIAGYRAVWSPELATIECALDRAESPDSTPFFEVRHARQMLEELGYQAGPESLLASGRRTEFALDGGLSVSIGPAGNFHRLLMWSSDAAMVLIPGFSELDDAETRLTLRIEGVHASMHDDAVEVLRRVGDSLLFGLDLSLGLALGLARGRDVDVHSQVAPKQQIAPADEPPLPQVRYEYDTAPMSLYWYARGASGMPLLRFLALYQILEFYFPVYSERRAQGTLRNLLKDPTFNPDRDADVAQLLRAVKAGTGGRGFGGEASQLKATIEECVSAEELRDFLLSDDERYRFYTSDDSKKVVRERLQVREESADHREAVAKRIYAIRNRIVHTKGGGEGNEPLFPFDPEVAYIGHDLDLVSFLARKTLISSSRPLRL